MKRYGFNFGDDSLQNQSGFTLIELIMVIVIIGLVAGVAVPKFVDLSDSAEAAKCKANQAAVEAAAALAYADNAFAGNPMFPNNLKKAMFKHNAIPRCPVKKKIIYSDNYGTASCPNNIPEHARYSQ